MVHHDDRVMRGRSQTKKFFASRHSRVVDRLNVDAVLRHQIIGQFYNQLRVTDLCNIEDINNVIIKASVILRPFFPQMPGGTAPPVYE